MAAKLSEGKRIKHARLHLRDCATRARAPNEYHNSCSSCRAAKGVLAAAGIEIPPLPNPYLGVYW